MSCKLSLSLGSSCRGSKTLRLSAMLISGRVVTRNRNHAGSLQKLLAITSSNSLRPWYSLSSKPSITIMMFLPGSLTLERGSMSSNSKRSLTSMLFRSPPKFLESTSRMALLYSGIMSDSWQAKDWSITLGFLRRALPCWQKWLPDSLLALSILLQTTAEITDFPIPACPLITKTRFSELLSSIQSCTFVKIGKRVPSWYRSEWYSTSFPVSIFASALRISSSLSLPLRSSTLSMACQVLITVFFISSSSLESSRRAWRNSSILCAMSVWDCEISISCDLVSSSLFAHSLKISTWSSSPECSSFNLSMATLSKPRATRTVLISCHKTEKVGVSIAVVDTWPYNSLRKTFTRARFASRELSLGDGMECHPERGGESPQMLVRRRNKRVMSNVFESGVSPPVGNSLSHWASRRTFFLKRDWRAE